MPQHIILLLANLRALDLAEYQFKALKITSDETCEWICHNVAKLSFTTIRNLAVASIYILNPVQMRKLNNMPVNNYLNGSFQAIDGEEIYSFVTTDTRKTSSTSGAAEIFITMAQKEMIDRYLHKYKLRDKQPIFGKYKGPSNLSGLISIYK